MGKPVEDVWPKTRHLHLSSCGSEEKGTVEDVEHPMNTST